MNNNENNNNNIEENYKEQKQSTCSNKEILYEDNEQNYRYRGFWSGFGDQ